MHCFPISVVLSVFPMHGRFCGVMRHKQTQCKVSRVVDAGACAQCLPEMKAVVKALREEHGAKTVGAQGFCWGGAAIKTMLCSSITTVT